MKKNLRKTPTSEFSFKRLMASLLLILLFVYLGLVICARLFADKLIFQPQAAFYADDETIIKLMTADGEKIAARIYENPQASFTILFSHGNAEDIGSSDTFSRQLAKSGFSVFTYDYRGYGTSEGTASEENLYEDIEAAYQYLIEARKIAPEKIILFGRSLGAAAAIDLASRRRVGGLIVESGFVSAFRVLTVYPLMPFDKFKNLSKIKMVKCPVLFIHGRKDNLISFWHGETLYAAANEPKSAFWLDAASHNNVAQTGGAGYLQRIRDFADNLPK